jgi:CRISPR/Cas system-associated exonuclease Cas4 (RecB family)
MEATPIITPSTQTINKIKRNYQNDYPSVTTVLGVLRKIGLEYWFKYNTAKFCDEKSNRGKLIGTQIHEAIENYILKNTVAVNTEYPEEVTNALKSFMEFRKDKPELNLEWSEIMMTSELHKFNGTMDCKAKIGEVPIVLDWKTGEAKKKDRPDIYDEYKYQVAAYTMAYNEINKCNIERAIIVSFAKDKVAYSIYEMGKEEIADCFEIFLSCLKIYNYQKKEKNYGL